MSIQKVLIANRGEIVSRIARTLKKLGKKSVAIYSDLDVNAEYIRHTDEAVYIGGVTVSESYNNMESILTAVKKSGADAVHPGYGFLSENPSFARSVEQAGFTFIGPSSECISMMSDKVMAKKIALEASINLVPGYLGEISDYEQAVSIAKEIGFPVLIKAAAGGGGKGMRLVNREEELREAMQLACHEALNFFSDERIFIEKYITNPRHIEIQIIADKNGHVICLGERECSVQRRHQKVVEEAPSLVLDRGLREKMYEQSIRLARAVSYTSVGTVEYILDQERNFYFMEMNARIQVEHPVTEMITDIDIVEEMIRIAEGNDLSKKKSVTKFNGWSFEARIYAEDPINNFMPTSGFVRCADFPTDVRVESSVSTGSEVGMFYDPMMAKIIVKGKTRSDALERMCEALQMTCIVGVRNNLVFLESLFRNADFINGNISTHFVEKQYQGVSWYESLDKCATLRFIAVTLYAMLSIWSGSFEESRAFIVRLGSQEYEVDVSTAMGTFSFTLAKEGYAVEPLRETKEGLFLAKINDEAFAARFFNTDKLCKRVEYDGLSLLCVALPKGVYTKWVSVQKNTSGIQQSDKMVSAMTGVILSIYVSVGDIVRPGDPLFLVEAMKMQNTITAERTGTVKEVCVVPGQNVSEGDLLLKFLKV
ncbi:propionyl-CoA carboxylase alpha chain [Neorickettsia risticii str. Illinois]|uniref:Propionyl-CoA carboxylase alpha chain n=1 Tax=Neorickettsia risticii (strain Illinois) TaxID=434131 RepID=C6V5T5_NEORI|nr:biotin carboxylase N-terminal domain-containing protein [Neorickettsia risticii]ACT69747.1 propionyl-CoA carboxylase alpha chain [Neorickettsia risticii str. Illinois]